MTEYKCPACGEWNEWFIGHMFYGEHRSAVMTRARPCGPRKVELEDWYLWMATMDEEGGRDDSLAGDECVHCGTVLS